MTTALLTDHYEFTMLDAALHEGTNDTPVVFEAFARRLPEGRRYGVVGGTGRLIEAIMEFRFPVYESEFRYLTERGFLSKQALDYLADYRFTGEIEGYAEGDLYFPYSPIFTVRGTFAECVVLETLILSTLNHDSAIASAASRMRTAAGTATLIEGGGRRTDPEAAVSAARAAYIGGFDATSNLAAGCRYGIPTGGTAAHAWTLLHDDERAAFRAQAQRFGSGTTFLVDTYDISSGIENAVEVCREVTGRFPAGVRIDSGDLALEAEIGRALLHELGATATEITASGDLDEFLIAKLVDNDAPIDRFLVGTKLVTGSGHPTAEMVYKLVEVAGRPVEKRSSGKASVGGRKHAFRVLDEEGHASEERVVVRFTDDHPRSTMNARALQETLWGDDRIGGILNPTFARDRHSQALAELRPIHQDITPGRAALSAWR
jgi:nicotinate phosphoribosyltransferase